MGQTLTHGIYLPDEGERNCYDGLASNWSILDGAVGTVAEHTTQIAGKAPAVHTHTKADITDFPVYGTTAGTICEGNDSRLSDARTPVAHTHTKSDVTDLLNSNFIPSANNSYDLGSSNYQWNNIYSKQYYGENVLITKNNTPKITIVDTRADRTYNATQTEESACRVEVADKDNALLSRISTQFTTDKRTKMLFTAYTEDTSGNQISKDLLFNVYQNGTCSFNPGQNNAIDLGSSSYQWNNLYAKNYYYNGTAWGLDKANVWTTYNTFTGDARPIRLRGSNNDIYNVQPQSAVYSQIDFVDKNNETMSYILFQHRADATETHRLCLRQKRITLDAYYSVDLNNLGDFYPEQSNAINLGTSNNKWKTLNGVNPGALGLPSGNYDPIDTKNWDLTGATGQSYTPTVNGWLFISIQNIAGNYLSIVAGRGAISMDGTGAQTGLRAMLPVIANESVAITVKTSVIFAARFYPMQGNVS